MDDSMRQAIHDRILRDALALPIEVEKDMLQKGRAGELLGYEMIVGLWAEVRALRIVAYYQHPLLERILSDMTAIATAIANLQTDEDAIASSLTALGAAQAAATKEMGQILTDLVAEQTLVGNGPAQLTALQALHTQLAAVPGALSTIATALSTATAADVAGDTVTPPDVAQTTPTAVIAATIPPVAASTIPPVAAVTIPPTDSATVSES